MKQENLNDILINFYAIRKYAFDDYGKVVMDFNKLYFSHLVDKNKDYGDGPTYNNNDMEDYNTKFYRYVRMHYKVDLAEDLKTLYDKYCNKEMNR